MQNNGKVCNSTERHLEEAFVLKSMSSNSLSNLLTRYMFVGMNENTGSASDNGYPPR